jgi:hypothetical protein
MRIFFVLAAAYLALIFFRAAPALHDESLSYFEYGVNLVRTGTYGSVPGVSDDLREPGYGTYLAVVMAPALFFERVSAAPLSQEFLLRWIVCAQALCFLACLWAFLRFARLPERLKWFCAALALLSPTLWASNGDIYSEPVAVCGAFLLMTLISREGWRKPRALVAGSVICTWLLLTKMYWMYFFPLVVAGAILAGLRARSRFALPLAVPCLVAVLVMLAWGQRRVERPQLEHMRTILQLAGKVYRHESWNLATEWKPALLASCCLATCSERYGVVCDKFTWTVSDNVGYALVADWQQHPERHEKNLLAEILLHWARTFPEQILSSGLELLRIVFFEAATVYPDSPAWWRWFGKLWHLLGSAAIGTLALLGMFRLRRTEDPGLRRTALLAGAFVLYHLVIMAQVTNVQRYSVPMLPYLYFFAAAALSGRRGEVSERPS